MVQSKKAKENSAVEINLNRNVMSAPAKNHLQNLLFNANHQKWDIHEPIWESGDKKLLLNTQSSLFLARSKPTILNPGNLGGKKSIFVLPQSQSLSWGTQGILQAPLTAGLWAFGTAELHT